METHLWENFSDLLYLFIFLFPLNFEKIGGHTEKTRRGAELHLSLNHEPQSWQSGSI
jgi:hypothetical protein